MGLVGGRGRGGACSFKRGQGCVPCGVLHVAGVAWWGEGAPEGLASAPLVGGALGPVQAKAASRLSLVWAVKAGKRTQRVGPQPIWVTCSVHVPRV